ncbi:hypothetical protein B0F90DRAFT_1809436 [Multifurca ochricompacta]|uniref:DUF427 domain-containing protein n=1 Tax=Multifurca ochricompacta TaxID=376703 RepID=A0AAD4QME1_9AGAM|nr:hypothetical protein B0F90DRAFT_1809436 [Multifurca ochricompacta]
MPVPFPHAGYSEDAQRHVRVLFGGEYIIDTHKAKLVWEHPYYPYYYFHSSDLSERFLRNPKHGEKYMIYDLIVADRTAEEAVTVYTEGDFKNLVDAWLEEDEEIYIHPKDPYKRIDIRQSSHHVRIEIDGIELANTTKPRLLFETGLPVRTYIPKGDGIANYYDVNLPSGKKKGLVWWYRAPFPESVEIKGYIAFYDEKVDVFVDGKKVERPNA